MAELEVKFVRYTDINAELISKAKKERVTFANPANTFWLGAYYNNNLVGITAVTINKTSKSARFKSSYVHPDYRKLGIYKKLFDKSILLCVKLKMKKVTGFCTPMSRPMYVKNGFKAKSNKGDIVFMSKTL